MTAIFSPYTTRIRTSLWSTFCVVGCSVQRRGEEVMIPPPLSFLIKC